jgi:alkyldihydroxyacetonephosphate synthase
LRPTPPIGIAEDWARVRARFGRHAPLDEAVLRQLSEVCARVDTDDESCVEAGRDWWPLAISWATSGEVPARAGAVARPADAGQVASVLAVCNEQGVPVTPAAGRSGVCGASVPLFGGVSLDLCGMSGLADVDQDSLLVSVLPGTFGDYLEQVLQADHGLTLGHWPQSMALSTVGGWVACRSAGQYSTRYGKVEDMVRGLEVATADGRLLRTGSGAPRSATGPDLTALFVGSEGTLGVVTEATLCAHPVPASQRRSAWAFASMTEGLEACRRTLRRGSTPAVLRLYDEAESSRHFGTEGVCALVVLDEGDPAIVDAAVGVAIEECARSGSPLEESIVLEWLDKRNDTSALAPLVSSGIVVDTIEVAARWSALPALYESATSAVRALDGTLVCSAHQSHSYTDGACLYFTFAGRAEDPERYYTSAWEAVMNATRSAGGAISHHHGIGMNRARFLPPAMGPAFGALSALKSALDPKGILNPGKLGLAAPFGPVPWP